MQQLDMYTQLLIQHQHNERQAKLAQRILVREALANRRARPALYKPFRLLLVGVGKRMVIWGFQLQRRYDDLASASASLPDARRETTWAVQHK